MKLYLVRHGDSEPAGSDDERPLSQKGLADIKQLAQRISPFHLHVSRMVQSQKRRAQQTAQILASSMTVDSIETTPELDPSASLDFILKDLLLSEEDVLLVGHMPFMGKLASRLLANNEEKNIVYFKTGTMLCLEKIGDEWMIRWMLPPSLSVVE